MYLRLDRLISEEREVKRSKNVILFNCFQIFSMQFYYMASNFNQIKSSFIILPVSRLSVYVTSLGGLFPRHCSRHHSSFLQRWQHCVQFDRPEISTSDLSLPKRTHCRSTNWLVLASNSRKTIIIRNALKC